jgi:hypothetical protein
MGGLYVGGSQRWALPPTGRNRHPLPPPAPSFLARLPPRRRAAVVPARLASFVRFARLGVTEGFFPEAERGAPPGRGRALVPSPAPAWARARGPPRPFLGPRRASVAGLPRCLPGSLRPAPPSPRGDASPPPATPPVVPAGLPAVLAPLLGPLPPSASRPTWAALRPPRSPCGPSRHAHARARSTLSLTWTPPIPPWRGMADPLAGRSWAGDHKMWWSWRGLDPYILGLLKQTTEALLSPCVRPNHARRLTHEGARHYDQSLRCLPGR